MGRARPRIALVDDDAMLVRALERALRLEGFDVASTTSGSDVSDLLRTFRPHIALFDVKMPQISGPALVSLARFTADSDVKTKYILYSGIPLDKLRVLAEESGADGYLTKDDDLMSLAEALTSFLDPRDRPS